MHDLTITQEYLICAMNEKGKISGLTGTEKIVCFVAAGLLELKMANCLKIEKKAVSVTNQLPADKMHLQPLYDFLNQGKPVKLDKILNEYNYSITDKRVNELIDKIGVSLQNESLVEITEGGVFGRKKAYIPTQEAIHYVIDMIRSELLENGAVSEEIAILVILLAKSKTLKTYFSDFEQKEIKAKLKEITESETGKLVKEMVDYVETMIAIMSTLFVVYS